MKSVPLNAAPRSQKRHGGVKKLRDAGRIPADSPAFPFAETLTDPFHLHLAKASLADDMRVKLLCDLAYATALESFWTYLPLELLIIVTTPWTMLGGVGR